MTGGVVTGIVVVLIAVAGLTIIAVSYFRLQRHRADAAAMDSYRKLAADVAESQRAVDDQLRELTTRVRSMEDMLRDVG